MSKKSTGSSKLFSLDYRDFNEFADKVVKNDSSIVYTDFATHVGPIVLALRDYGENAIGYYGKMKESEKDDAYLRWKKGDTSDCGNKSIWTSTSSRHQQRKCQICHPEWLSYLPPYLHGPKNLEGMTNPHIFSIVLKTFIM